MTDVESERCPYCESKCCKGDCDESYTEMPEDMWFREEFEPLEQKANNLIREMKDRDISFKAENRPELTDGPEQISIQQLWIESTDLDH